MFFDHVPAQGLICAHRGARSIAPENTLLAMHRAYESGAHCWETDVRVSRDNELIIFHDDELMRTTDFSTHPLSQNRKSCRVDRFTLAELRELDAGSWFLKDDPFGTVADNSAESVSAIQGQQIPLLSEILRFSKTRSFPVNIEIKDLKTLPGDVAVVDRVTDMLHDTGTMELVLLSSFRHEYLHRAKALNPKIAIAVLVRDSHPSDLISYLQACSAAAYHPEKHLCDAELVSWLHWADIRVNCWTVNRSEQAKQLMAMGAGVITDRPQQMITL